MNIVKSSINILGGYENLSNLPGIFSDQNVITDMRTLSSKERYNRAIKDVFLRFDSEQTKLLFLAAMSSVLLSEDAKLRVMALQFYSNDFLFRLLFKDCFLPIYNSGRLSINKHDIIAFLDEQIRNGQIEVGWTKETIDTVSRKFLTVLKKLVFLEGKVNISIKEPYIGTDFLTFFHFWLMAINNGSNVFNSSYFSLLMLSREKYQFLMKQPEIREKIDWYFTAEKFTIEPKITINEYINELSS